MSAIRNCRSMYKIFRCTATSKHNAVAVNGCLSNNRGISLCVSVNIHDDGQVRLLGRLCQELRKQRHDVNAGQFVTNKLNGSVRLKVGMGYLSKAKQEICLLWTPNYFTVLTNTVAAHLTTVTYRKFARARLINPHCPFIYSFIYIHLLTAWQMLRIMNFLLRFLETYKAYVASVIHG
jgi:triacylglycerol esterase/lipase EstA (alpha/beta hydrolase family)